MAFLAALPVLGSLFASSAAAGTAAAGTAAATAAAGTTAAVAGTSDLAAAALAASLVGGGISAYGSYQAGQAQKGAANYNAAVAKENADIAQQNINIAGQSAEAQAGISAQKTRAAVGSLEASQAASGLDINTGSPVDTRRSAGELGALDTLTIRSNAIRQAYGYETEKVGLEAESALDTYEAQQAGLGGEIGAAGTFLGAAGNAGENFANYLYRGGLTI